MQRGFSVRFGRDDRDAEPTRAAQRLGRVFSAEPWQESLLGLIKLGVLSWVLLEGMRGSLPGLLDVRDPSELLQLALRLGRSMGLRAVVALALLGGIDLLFQHWRRARRLRMSRRELQEEQRESEGDPRWLGERRARSQALWSQAWLAELEAASLVIAASDRALALRYRPGIDAAPSLWVKGQGLSCERLLEHARSLDLPVHIDEALAHDLYRLEPSEIIPEATQQRVAALFARSAGTA
jgi:flagellar biosynthetic protein FlhB